MSAPSKSGAGRHLVGLAWRGLRRWLKDYTFAPRWLPERWRHPFMGYFWGVLLVAVAVAIDCLLLMLFPAFGVPGLLAVLAVLLTALTWGAGPSLLATLASVALLDYFDITPRMVIAQHAADLLADDALLVLVGIVISLIALQVQRARNKAEAMRDEAEKAAERWHALQFISETAFTNPSLDELLQAVLERVCAALSIEYCAILLLDETGQTLKIRAAYGLEPELARQTRIPLGQGGAGIIAATGEPLLIPDLAAFGTAHPYFSERFRSFVGAPLRMGEQVIGVLCMTSALPDHFTEEDIHLLELLASRLALLIDHARLNAAERRAHAEAVARASQLEAIFESLAEGVMVFDTQGRITRANSTARYFMGPGIPESDYYSYSLADWSKMMLARDDQGNPIPDEQLPVNRALRGETLTGDQSQELLLRKLDGSEVIIHSSSAPIYDAEGQIIGAVSTFHDVTERRRLERRTLEALKGLLTIAQSLMQAPDVPSFDLEQADQHPSMLRLAELMAQIMGCYRLGIFSFLPQKDALLPVAVAGLEATGEEPWRFEGICRYEAFMARLLGGKPFLWDVHQPPLSYQLPTGGIQEVLVVPMVLRDQLVGALFLDYGVPGHVYTPDERSLAEGSALLAAMVLERERLLREREEARANELALREANRRLDEFLGVASHELRTPLTSIILGLQLFRRRSERFVREEGEVTKEPLERFAALFNELAITERQTQRLDRLVNDLLDISRIQTGRLTLHRRMVDLRLVVAEVLEEQRQAVPGREILLSLPEQSVRLSLDPERIAQVITNYLTNALKYSAEDQPVEVGLEVEDQTARVWVRDWGPGFPLEEQAVIWERFHRVPGVEVRSGSGVGLGLGLYISRTIIEAHQGQVGVQSFPGIGTTFWFTLALPQ